ncbi:tail fiber domain-containing protein [Flavobacterium channae]|uniref:tail fiber domain-containing protein n=1 Tax=Flavobacterium channae TaxID=2897181 RepID=UPI001E3E741F|nr:tail fiber domain-containing protein [Flavobacterium channae]UGS23395.1 tail fiber domain-containing protein [Flavobacterium channae]
MKKFYFLILGIVTAGYSQVGINTATPAAQLEIKSSNQAVPANTDGVLIPKIDTFPAINPTILQQGMLVYLTTTSGTNQPGFYYWDNTTTSWKGFGNGSGWSLTGNTGTNPTTNFLGTTDDKSLFFRVNNQHAGRIDTNTGEGTGGNVFLGITTGQAVNSGSHNVAIGVEAFMNNSGALNTAIGSYALQKNTSGDSNIAVGSSALYENTVGTENIAIGRFAYFNNKSGSNGVAIGVRAMQYADNTATAYQNHNVAVGFEAIQGSSTPANNTGNLNTAIGFRTLSKNTSGSGNSAVGDRALSSNTTGEYNNAFGYLSLFGNTTGTQNNAHGSEVLLGNSSGSYNSGFGYRALNGNNGNYNSAFGNGSMFNNKMASNNVAVGYRALSNQQFSNGNVAFDTNNVAVGVDALLNNNPTSTSNGIQNTALGNYALNANTTGYRNTALGNRALFNNTTGYQNTAVGYNVYPTSSTSLNNYTGLGYNVGGGTSTSNMVEIGNTSVASIRGQVNFTTYSDQRIKNNIKEDVPGLNFITQLRPVTYNLDIHKQNAIIYKDKQEANEDWEGKYDIENIKQTGFIAQEVAQTAKSLNFDFSGIDAPKKIDGLYGLRYAEFVVPLVKAVQEQQQIIEEQNEKIKQLEAINKEILNRLEKLETK